MEWLGWLAALVMALGAIWLLRAYRATSMREQDLLCEKMELENELDNLHAERVANPPPESLLEEPPAPVVAGVPVAAVRSALEHLDELASQLDEYRERNRSYDAAVQQALQPLELLIDADKETMDVALAHISTARKPLFAARGAVQKSPLQRGADALQAARAALDVMPDPAESDAALDELLDPPLPDDHDTSAA